VVQKYEEIGLDQKGFRKFNFKEFNIRDMYEANKELCYFCAQSIFCKKHEFTKKNTYLKDGQFEEAENEDMMIRHKVYIEKKAQDEELKRKEIAKKRAFV
jgi:hypothetical protein